MTTKELRKKRLQEIFIKSWDALKEKYDQKEINLREFEAVSSASAQAYNTQIQSLG